jgi:hypothetical protein
VLVRVIGKALPGVDTIEHRPERVMTGNDGRFRVEGLAPGLHYRCIADEREIAVGPLAAGEVKDLGKLVPAPSR